MLNLIEVAFFGIACTFDVKNGVQNNLKACWAVLLADTRDNSLNFVCM